MTRTILRTATTLALAVLVGGCTAKMEQRISLLEDTNRTLTDRINGMQAEVDAVSGERDDLSERLAATNVEADHLRAQVAEARSTPADTPVGIAAAAPAMITIDGSELFTAGRATLRRQSQRTLDAAVSTLQGKHADQDILVFGHTDNQPIKKSGWKDNWQLSTERALAVARYLEGQGIPASRLVACGAGEHRPRAENSSEKNRAANRRVEIVTIDQQVLGAP